MRTHVVLEGDSPASIAIRYAGCPKCARDLTGSTNPHKRTVVFPNGFETFASIAPGEVLNLPDSWFDGTHDARPPAYFKRLPHADGVTPGTLGDFPDLDLAVSRVASLAAMDDAAFSGAAGAAAAAIDAAAREAYGSTKSAVAAEKAKTVQDATGWAWRRNRDLAAALAAGDTPTVVKARLDVQNALATALGNARLAILAHYPSAAAAPVVLSADLQAAARAAATVIQADPNYCTSVTHPGNPVNAAVHRFKLAWNATQGQKVPIGTGTYEEVTTVALAQVLGSAPSACSGQRPVPAPKPPPPALPTKRDETVTAPSQSGGGWSAWKVAAGVAVVAAAGAGAYLVTRPKKPTVRRTIPEYA
ncbi:MAG TPA: hypothetical protein VIX35_08460 [Vicinamibacterales bacterium]